MLSVLQVIPSLDTGGAERAAIDIAAALSARGDRALVASEGGRLESDLTRAGGVLYRLPVGSKNPLVMAANVARLAALIRRERVDIVHARSRAPAWSARLASRLTRVSFVTTYHGIYAESGTAKRFYNSVMAAGRHRHRQFGVHCPADPRALRDARVADRNDSARHRPRALRSEGRRRRAPRRAPPRLRARRRRARHPAARAAHRMEGPACSDRGAFAAAACRTRRPRRRARRRCAGPRRLPARASSADGSARRRRVASGSSAIATTRRRLLRSPTSPSLPRPRRRPSAARPWKPPRWACRSWRRRLARRMRRCSRRRASLRASAPAGSCRRATRRRLPRRSTRRCGSRRNRRARSARARRHARGFRDRCDAGKDARRSTTGCFAARRQLLETINDPRELTCG